MNASAPISRRHFLQAGTAGAAGLVLSFYLPVRGQEAPPPLEPNAWLQIAPSGEITLWAARSEMGQGVRTSLPMILAEELEADWARIRVVQADLDPKYGDQLTGGSFSVNYSWEPLRRLGAAAREMLRTAAARTWNVPVAECAARQAVVTHMPSGRRLSYAELAQRAAALPVPQNPPLKEHKDFRIVGHATPRVDGPQIVTGTATYGMDVKLPGMLYAAVARCPVFGGKVKKYSDARARAVPGVRSVVELPRVEMPVPFSGDKGGVGHQHFLWGGVAVVADSTWAALEGRKALEIEWDEGPAAAESTEVMRRTFMEFAAQGGTAVRTDGDPDGALASAANRLEADYEVPFLSHAPMEPPNCTAHVRDGRCELWGPMQNAQGVKAALMRALEVPSSAVTIHVTLLGGGFGRRLNLDYGVEAALISRAAKAPVKVVWTREDDITHDYYRPAGFHRLRAGLDAAGNLVAWTEHIVAPTTAAFYNGPESPDVPTSELTPGVFPAGVVPHFRISFSHVPSAVPRGWWRSVEDSANTFVVQSFTDEVAAAAGKDPLAFRRDLFARMPLPSPQSRFRKERLLGVLNLAAEKAGWGTLLQRGRGRGIAAQYCFGSYIAEVAEVTVSRNGALRVDRVVAAIDCGQVINPDMVAAQVEGGIAFGLSPVLKSAITVDRGRVQQTNFHAYQVLRINEMPRVEVSIVPSTAPPTGVGEPGLPPIAPAVTNAIFAATGKRIRRLPIRL